MSNHIQVLKQRLWFTKQFLHHTGLGTRCLMEGWLLTFGT